MEPAPIRVVHRIEPEDRARANFYAVLAALYADAPDAALLRAIGAAEPLPEAESGTLPEAWNTLLAACPAMDPEAARQEYVDLFVGTGRSEVNLHASHWLSGFMMEKPLVALRDELAGLGLGRLPRSNLLEDHVAALFEAMRALIEGGEHGPPRDLATQAGFFERNLAPWIDDCCNAIIASPLAERGRKRTHPGGAVRRAFQEVQYEREWQIDSDRILQLHGGQVLWLPESHQRHLYPHG